MHPTAPDGLLAELATRIRATATTGALLECAVPLLREISAAGTVAALRPDGGIVARSGEPLNEAGYGDLVGHPDVVPSCWPEVGRVEARAVAAGLGLLVFAWHGGRGSEDRQAGLALALALVDAALARLAAEERMDELAGLIQQARQAQQESVHRFVDLVESAPDAILVHDRSGVVLQSNGTAVELLGGDPVGRAIDAVVPPGRAGDLAVEAAGLDGRQLRLDVRFVPLRRSDGTLVAVYLRDAQGRLDSEAVAARLHEARTLRRQALEMNDNVVQGLSAASLALQLGDVERAADYLDTTLGAARRMMNKWLEPLDGTDLQPGDLVRETPSTLGSTTTGVTTLADNAADQPAGTSGSERPRVLIADDFQDVRMLLRLQLQRTGRYDVVGEAGNGEEAVELATSLQPDVVLLDMSMPKMDGLQALPLIRDAVPGVHVLVLSGFDEGTMAQKALELGADGYIEKGLRMNLADKIEGVLNQP